MSRNPARELHSLLLEWNKPGTESMWSRRGGGEASAQTRRGVMLLNEIYLHVEASTKATGRAPAIAAHLDKLFAATVSAGSAWQSAQQGSTVPSDTLDVLDTYADVIDARQSALQGTRQTDMSELADLLNEAERLVIEEYPDLPKEFRQYLLILIERLRAAINYQAAFNEVDVRMAADALVGALHSLAIWDEASPSRRDKVLAVVGKVASKVGYGAVGVLGTETGQIALKGAARILELTQGN